MTFGFSRPAVLGLPVDEYEEPVGGTRRQGGNGVGEVVAGDEGRDHRSGDPEGKADESAVESEYAGRHL